MTTRRVTDPDPEVRLKRGRGGAVTVRNLVPLAGGGYRVTYEATVPAGEWPPR